VRRLDTAWGKEEKRTEGRKDEGKYACSKIKKRERF
jgi:hypothetical protein